MKITKRQLKSIIREYERDIPAMKHKYGMLPLAHKQFFDRGFDEHYYPYYVEYDPDVKSGKPWLVFGEDMLLYDMAENEALADEYAEDLNSEFQSYARSQRVNESFIQAPGELGMATKDLMSILKSIKDPMERNAEIYNIVDQLEDLASRGR